MAEQEKRQDIAVAGAPGSRAVGKDGSSGAHIPALDGVRAFAILLVLQMHFFPKAGYERLTVWDLSDARWWQAAWECWRVNVHMLSGTGVDLFFVLSGYLITGILLRAEPSRRNFLAFYGRRTLRIFPLYYVTLGGLYFLFRHYEADGEYLERLPWLATYTTNLVIAVRQAWPFKVIGISLDHFWSLGLEEQFYLIWPALVFLCPRPWLWRLCWALVVLAVATRLGFVLGGNPFAAMMLLPARVDSLAMGALLALRGDLSTFSPRAWLMVLGGAVLIFVSYIDERLVIVFGWLGCAIVYAGFIALALRPGRHWILENPALVAIGKYSYAIYVLHPILKPFVFMYLLANAHSLRI